MKNHLEYLKIENFKSIKQAHFECSKVNVFIGKPNVGKSNILEVISLMSIYKYGLQHLRIENTTNLFYDNDTSFQVNIASNNIKSKIEYIQNGDVFVFKSDLFIEGHGMTQFSFNFRLPAKENVYTPEMPLAESIKRYSFNGFTKIDSVGPSYLMPPFGTNLVSILNQRKDLHHFVTSYLNDFGYKFKINISEKKLSLQKEGDGNIVYEIPFGLTAETFRRIIFHLLAIKTNKESVICLEEPEAHIYPPYIRDIVEAIADDETNQFFIATHSSSFLVDLLERVPENLRLFVVYFENFETKIKQISDEEISKYLSNGSDFFYHLDELIEA